jgi:hypothetical protein
MYSVVFLKFLFASTLDFIRSGEGTFSMSFKHLDRHIEKNPSKMPANALAGFFTMVNAGIYQISFENICTYMYLSMTF